MHMSDILCFLLTNRTDRAMVQGDSESMQEFHRSDHGRSVLDLKELLGLVTDDGSSFRLLR